MRRAGAYQLQAAISAVHADAARAIDTDWAQIVVLYRLLHRMIPSPIIELNFIVAVAMAQGMGEGLRLLHDFEKREDLLHYYLLHAARADMLRRSAQWDAAEVSYQKALETCDNAAERHYLENRLHEVRAKLNERGEN